jgi:hypothetical protein
MATKRPAVRRRPGATQRRGRGSGLNAAVGSQPFLKNISIEMSPGDASGSASFTLGVNKSLALYLVTARATTPAGSMLVAGIQTGQGELPIVLIPQGTSGDDANLAAHQTYPLDIGGRGIGDSPVWRITASRSVSTGTSRITVLLWGSLVALSTGGRSSRGRRKTASPDRPPPR